MENPNLLSAICYRPLAIGHRLSAIGYWLLAIGYFLVAGPALAALTSEVRPHNGLPSLYVNGQLTSQITAAPYRPGAANFMDFQKSGNRIYDIYFRFTWSGPTNYDFSRVDQLLADCIKLDTNALFIGRILLTPGAWLARDFPDEVSRRDDGSLAG